jgi:PBP1b-binding outer membrane lipoprotein LpoB
MKTSFKKIIVMALLSAGIIAGCKREQNTNQNPAPVNYQVTDRLQATVYRWSMSLS